MDLRRSSRGSEGTPILRLPRQSLWSGCEKDYEGERALCQSGVGKEAALERRKVERWVFRADRF